MRCQQSDFFDTHRWRFSGTASVVGRAVAAGIDADDGFRDARIDDMEMRHEAIGRITLDKSGPALQRSEVAAGHRRSSAINGRVVVETAQVLKNGNGVGCTLVVLGEGAFEGVHKQSVPLAEVIAAGSSHISAVSLHGLTEGDLRGQ